MPAAALTKPSLYHLTGNTFFNCICQRFKCLQTFHIIYFIKSTNCYPVVGIWEIKSHRNNIITVYEYIEFILIILILIAVWMNAKQYVTDLPSWLKVGWNASAIPSI